MVTKDGLWWLFTLLGSNYIFPNTFFTILGSVQFSSVTQSCSTLRPQGLQHARPPCPSPTPGAYSNSCPSSRWCHPAISSCRPLFLLASIFPSVRAFSSESVLHIRCPKCWSFIFSISPSNEYSGLISFRIYHFATREADNLTSPILLGDETSKS